MRTMSIIEICEITEHITIGSVRNMYGVLCVAIVSQPVLYEKNVSNMVEVKSRGGYLFVLANENISS